MTTRRDQAVLIAVTAADSLAVGLMLPLLPFLALDVGAGPFAIGTLVAVASVASLVAAPLWGGLADRWGTRRLLLIAPLLSATGHVLFAFSGTFTTMLVSRLVVGLGAAVPLLVQTHVVATSEGTDRTALLGRVTAAQGAGSIVGPMLGALLAPLGIVAVGLGAAAAPLIAITLIALFLPRPAQPPQRQQRRSIAAASALLRSRSLRPYAVATFFGWLAFMGYSAVLPIHLEDRLHISATVYGLIVGISGVVAVVVRGIALGPLAKRFGEYRLMITGIGLLAFSMVFAPVVPSVLLLPVLPLTWAMGASLLFPSLVAELSRAAPDGMAGLALGGSALLSGLGVVLGPIAAGGLIQVLWPAGPFLAGAAVVVAVAVVMPRPRSTHTEHVSSTADTRSAE